MLPKVQRGNGKPADLKLLEAIESGITAAPRAVRQAFPKNELVNATWLILKRRGIRKPTRLQVRCAAIDHHRSVTHFRRNPNKSGFQNRCRNVMPETNVDRRELHQVIEKRVQGCVGEKRVLLVDFLRTLRAKSGYRGVCQFLLTDVIGLDPELTGQALEE